MEGGGEERRHGEPRKKRELEDESEAQGISFYLLFLV